MSTSVCRKQTISLQEARVLEALQDDLEIPCVVQCGMFWFSAPASLNDELLNDGVTDERHNRDSQFGFPECLHSASLQDEHFKILFLQVNTYSVGERA